MAPDTEPTDEELAAVTNAARHLVLQQRALSDAWIAARLEAATKAALEYRARRQREPEDETQGVKAPEPAGGGAVGKALRGP